MDNAAHPRHGRRRPGRARKLVIGSVAAAAMGGAAFAYWSGTGAGTGSATTGDAAALTVNQTSTVTNLRPGSGTQDLSGTFTNPNPSAIYVDHLSATVTTDQVGCDADDYTIAGSGLVDAQVVTGDTWGGLTIEFNNSPTVNQDACKGATVTITYTAHAS